MINDQAIFLIGVTGSGKDFLLRTALRESGTELPLSKLYTAIKQHQDLAEVDGGPLIVNGNADCGGAILLSKQVLEAMGYNTAMVFVYVDDAISRQRSKIDEQKRLMKYNTSIQNMHSYKDLFGEAFFLFDNSSDFLSVNEGTQKQIVGWLEELSSLVEAHFQGKKKPVPLKDQGDTQDDGQNIKEDLDALFEKTYPTVLDMELQKKGKREGNKYSGGIAVAGSKDTSREVAESKQEVVVPQTQKPGIKYKKNRPAKGLVPPGDPADSRIIGATSGGTGYASFHVENTEK